MPNIGVEYLRFRSKLLAPVRLLQLFRAERLGARLALGQRRLREGEKDRLEAEFVSNCIYTGHQKLSPTT